MCFIVISAEQSNHMNGHVGGAQIQTGMFQTGIDAFLHTGKPEHLFIGVLQIRGAHVNRFRHGFNRPLPPRCIDYRHAELIQGIVVAVREGGPGGTVDLGSQRVK